VNSKHVFATPAEAAETCGAAIFAHLEKAAASGRATVAFSGGNTPKLMFGWMARQSFDWSKVHIFWADERCVPPDHADSNYRMTREALLDHIRPGGVHRIEGELDPTEAAARYKTTLTGIFGGAPAFDVLHLGMGDDAHTASLFPGLAETQDRSGIVAAVWVEKMARHRVTLLPAAILAAKNIAMLVTGADKASPLYQAFEGKSNTLMYPVQIVHREGRTVDWFLDRAAAAEIVA
jgi:6-phosphogluconolactonase